MGYLCFTHKMELRRHAKTLSDFQISWCFSVELNLKVDLLGFMLKLKRL